MPRTPEPPPEPIVVEDEGAAAGHEDQATRDATNQALTTQAQKGREQQPPLLVQEAEDAGDAAAERAQAADELAFVEEQGSPGPDTSAEATDGEADPDELDEIQRMGATGKARGYLIALRDSHPRAFYNPTDQTVVVNGVEVFVPRGRVTAKPEGELPQPLAMGCDLVLDALNLDPDAPADVQHRPRGHVRLFVAP